MGKAKLSMAEALQWLCRAEPTGRDLLEALQAWTAKTPAQAALTQASPAPHMLYINSCCFPWFLPLFLHALHADFTI